MTKDLGLHLPAAPAGVFVRIRQFPGESRNQPIHVVDAGEELRLVPRFIEACLVVHFAFDPAALRGVEKRDN